MTAPSDRLAAALADRYRPTRPSQHSWPDFTRLRLAEPFDVTNAKHVWLAALAEAEAFVRQRPPDETGGLSYPVNAGALRDAAW